MVTNRQAGEGAGLAVDGPMKRLAPTCDNSILSCIQADPSWYGSAASDAAASNAARKPCSQWAAERAICGLTFKMD